MRLRNKKGKLTCLLSSITSHHLYHAAELQFKANFVCRATEIEPWTVFQLRSTSFVANTKFWFVSKPQDV